MTATTRGQHHHADRQGDPGDELGDHDARTPRLEGEGDQPGALAGLARDQQDDQDREEVAQHPSGDAEEVAEAEQRVGGGEGVDHHDHEAEPDDRDREPAAGPGVEGLAQLGGGEPAHRHPRRRDVDRGGLGAVRAGGRGAHAEAPSGRTSRWVSEVSSRKRSSSPAPPERRSVRTTADSRATRPTSWVVQRDAQPVALGRDRVALLLQRRGQACVVERHDQRARLLVGGQQRLLVAPGHDLAVADQDHLVGDQLDLVEQVAREQHRAAAVGVALEERAHPPDAGGVEPVGGLVEDQHRRVAEQRVGDAEALLHAEGVVAQPALRLGGAERDQLEHLVDPRRRQPHRAGAQGEDLAAGAAGVLRRGVEQDADVPPGVRDVAVEVAVDGDPAVGGRGEADHHAHRGGLAGTVGTEEAGDPSGLAGEADVVDGTEAAVRLGEAFDGDHGSSLPHRATARQSRIPHGGAAAQSSKTEPARATSSGPA